ncbi:MAG: hypothetical protein ABIQ15_10895 [Nocardioides sp.]
MDIDYTETRRAVTRLRHLDDDLAARADVGTPDTGATPDWHHRLRPAGDLAGVTRETTRLASRLGRLAGALHGLSEEVRDVDDAHAHRLASLAAATVEAR